MNRLFTLCFFSVILFSNIHAQLNKGQWLVGGNVNFSLSRQNNKQDLINGNVKTTALQAEPGAGYFIIDKLAVGIRPGLSINNTNSNYAYNIGNNSFSSESISKSTAFTLSPFLRYYFLPKKNKINLLADASYAYAHSKVHAELNQVSIIDGQASANHNEQEATLKGSLFSLFAGPSIFISPTVGLELLAGYTYAKYKDASKGVNNFGLSAGFQIHLGK